MEFTTHTRIFSCVTELSTSPENKTEVPDFQVVKQANHLFSDFFFQPGYIAMSDANTMIQIAMHVLLGIALTALCS